jgi:hypothetical protein
MSENCLLFKDFNKDVWELFTTYVALIRMSENCLLLKDFNKDVWEQTPDGNIHSRKKT